MNNKFEQISVKPGFMKHNGGVLFREISDSEYEFKSKINENHLNAAGITHGGYLSALIDAGAGTAAHRASGNSPCVTISLDLKFIGASKVDDEITGYTKILKKTNTLIFLFCGPLSDGLFAIPACVLTRYVVPFDGLKTASITPVYAPLYAVPVISNL